MDGDARKSQVIIMEAIEHELINQIWNYTLRSFTTLTWVHFLVCLPLKKAHLKCWKSEISPTILVGNSFDKSS